LSTPVGQLPLSTAAERMEAFKQLRDYVKTRPHREAMAWVEEICGELGAEPAEHNVLGWEALRQLAREGVTLGAHTRTHPLVNRISIDEVRDEALGSLEDLRREVGQVPPIFAYPSGGFNDDVVRALGRAGFALAFTTAVGLNDLGRAHRLLLRRVNVGQRTNLAVLRARLLPWAVHLNRLEPLAGA
ncbi:MAG: polysaccharide deacetylase family protein, partial [Anaerolineales bacterium]